MNNRAQLLEELAELIIQIKVSHPLRVAIDGPDAAGKTTLAGELVPLLCRRGRSIITASIDGFHNPASVRHSRGRNSPQGYYYDSFDYQSLIRCLLQPLGPGGTRDYVPKLFDYRTDSEVKREPTTAAADAILLFDGVFLLRPELISYWDFTVFITVSRETILARGIERDAVVFGGAEEARKLYEQRYLPGQQLYFDQCRPLNSASIVVNNDDPVRPAIL